MANAPSSQLVSVMLGKEPTAGTAVIPTVTHICDSVAFDGTNETLDRTGMVKAVSETDPLAGMFTGKGTMDFEADPDTIGSLWLAILGSESVVATGTGPTSSLAAATNATTAAVAAGSTLFPVQSTTGWVAGMGIRLDPGNYNQEDLVVASIVAGVSITTTTTSQFAHNIGAGVIGTPAGQAHTFSIVSPRPNLTFQINEVLQAKNCFGARASQLDLTMSAKNELGGTLTVDYMNEAVVGSPTTPLYSQVNPFSFQASGNSLSIGGSVADADVQGWKMTVQTGLNTDNPKYGGGRFNNPLFQEGLTVVTLSIDMAYESTTQVKNFWGGQTASGPQAKVVSLPVSIVVNSPDMMNNVVQYGQTLNFGKCKILSAPVARKTKDYLKQTLSLKAYATSRGANDQLSVVLVNGSPNASL